MGKWLRFACFLTSVFLIIKYFRIFLEKRIEQLLHQSLEPTLSIPFLQILNQHEIQLTKLGFYEISQATTPLQKLAVTFQERSSDFMSPEIVRPFAVTNISHIAAMARRLGMTWAYFQPEDGIMRAEGNGYVLSSA